MKYIALKIDNSVNGAFIGLNEVSMLASNGDNILAGAAITATTEYNSDLGAYHLLDGKSGSSWTNNGSGGGQRAMFTLQNDFYGILSRLVVVGHSDQNVSPRTIELQVSESGNLNNENEWTTIKSFTDLVWAPMEPKTLDVDIAFNIPPSVDADKLRMQQIQFKLKIGEYITDDDSIFYMIGGDGEQAARIMSALDNGDGFNGLKALGLSDANAYRVLTIYNTKADTAKYESEKALEMMVFDINRFVDFKNYLDSRNIQLPSLDSYMTRIRSNHQVYTAAREWARTLPNN